VPSLHGTSRELTGGRQSGGQLGRVLAARLRHLRTTSPAAAGDFRGLANPVTRLEAPDDQVLQRVVDVAALVRVAPLRDDGNGGDDPYDSARYGLMVRFREWAVY